MQQKLDLDEYFDLTGNVILFPADRTQKRTEGPIVCRERLGGLLKFYDREAA